jgi:hypothetical protein
MDRFSYRASSLAAVLREPPARINATAKLQYEAEICRQAYWVIDSMTNDLAEAVGELRPDFVTLRIEAERVLRRYELAHPQSESEFRGALNWMSNHGNAEDLERVKDSRSTALQLSKRTLQRLDEVVESISDRTGIREDAREEADCVGVIKVTTGEICWLVAVPLLGFFAVTSIVGLLFWPGTRLGFGLSVGSGLLAYEAYQLLRLCRQNEAWADS